MDDLCFLNDGVDPGSSNDVPRAFALAFTKRENSGEQCFGQWQWLSQCGHDWSKKWPTRMFSTGAQYPFGVLTPAFDSAKAVCDETCAKEGKRDLCLNATNRSKLKQEGIDGIVDWIKANISVNNVNYTPSA